MRWQVTSAAVVTGAFAVVVNVSNRAPPLGIGESPGPACGLPPRECVEHCDELVEMPLEGPGYIDDRRDVESVPATSTSYLRRDLMMLVQYAAAKVACKSARWNTGTGGPIFLGDMSERDGSTPGMIWGMPRHPPNTHVGGRAIDIAYFQRDTADNKQHAICPHRDAAGREKWHCTAPPDHLDAWRTALFIGAFLEEPRIRVIGIDGRAAEPILSAFDELCDTGWIAATACRRDRIRFEKRDTGHGWFYGHHNHIHVALGD